MCVCFNVPLWCCSGHPQACCKLVWWYHHSTITKQKGTLWGLHISRSYMKTYEFRMFRLHFLFFWVTWNTYGFLVFRCHFVVFDLKTYEFLVFRWHFLFFALFSLGFIVFHVFPVSRRSSGWAGLGTFTENMKNMKNNKTICFQSKKQEM